MGEIEKLEKDIDVVKEGMKNIGKDLASIQKISSKISDAATLLSTRMAERILELETRVEKLERNKRKWWKR